MWGPGRTSKTQRGPDEAKHRRAPTRVLKFREVRERDLHTEKCTNHTGTSARRIWEHLFRVDAY